MYRTAVAAVIAPAIAAWAVAPVVVDSEAALGASAERAHARAVVAVHSAWEAAVVEVVLEEEAAAVVAVVEAAVAEGDK